MRLRLIIRRHTLPDAAVVWAIQDGENPTISQLLEQINEVMPLESGGDWGLEDYAVEIRGFRGSGTNFECFHFQQVQSILHEDDELLIRPLLSQDLKVRKVSGRHQITSDGKHLIDGCTFGRPKPRGPIDRPAIEIPPRKRRRLTYDVDTDSSLEGSPFAIESETHITDDQYGNLQLVLSADYEDDDREDDEDFEPSDEEEDEDLEAVIESDQDDSEREETIGSENDLASIRDDRMRAKVQKLRGAFPKAPVPLCEHILKGFNGNLGKAWEALTPAFKPAKPRKAIQNSFSTNTPPSSRKQRPLATSSKNKMSIFTAHADLRKADEDIDAPADEESSSFVNYYDKHGLPGSSISTASGILKSNRNVRFAEDSLMENIDNLLLDEEDEEDDEGFEAESSSIDDTDSCENLPSDSSDDSDPSVDATSTDEDGTSSSDSAPDEVSSKPAEPPPAKDNSIATAAPGSTKANQKPLVPPGQGKRRTQSRNERRRNAKQLQRFKNKGILPAGTTLTEFRRLDLNNIAAPDGALEAPTNNRADTIHEKTDTGANTKAADIESRRQQPLAAIASGGVEVGLESSSAKPVSHVSESVSNYTQMPEPIVAAQLTETDTSFTLRIIPDKSSNPNEFSGQALVDSTSANAAVLEQETESPAILAGSGTTDTVSRPRKKLDIGAAERLLFGALGVRAPKTKADHEKVRNDLVKDIKQTKSVPRTDVAVEEEDGINQDSDSEAWREVITLRAVECCHDGIELSPAPFPFIQRWDAQQQGDIFKRNDRSKKGKKNQRNQPQFYDEELPVTKKRKRKHNDAFPDSYEQDSFAEAERNRSQIQQNEDTGKQPGYGSNSRNLGSYGVEDAANNQIMRDVQEAATSQGLEEDDLPKLPEDISSLPNFVAGDVKTGMVIAFKQLLLSEATNWQPQMSAYRTAVIIKVSKSGELELTLAKRDREERQYDEETGERIWGKFDIPMDDDHDDDGDDGLLTVALSELVEPKILQQAPEGFTQAIATEVSQPQNNANHGNDGSTTTGHEDSVGTSKVFVESLQNNERKALSPHSAPNDDSDSLSLRGGELSADDAEEILAMSISEHTREEISELIRDAGFHSSVPSSVLRARPAFPSTPKPESIDGSYSPTFNGFGSNHSIEDLSELSLFNTPTPQGEMFTEKNEPDNQAPKTTPNLSSVPYPKIQVPSSLASHSQVSDRGRQPDYPTPGDDTLHQFDDMDSFLGDHNDLRPAENEHTLRDQPASISNGPQIENRPSHAVSENSSSSSMDFPTLDEVFSTARSVILPKEEIKSWRNNGSNSEVERIAESYDKAMEALDVEMDAAEDAGLIGAEEPESPTSRASQENGGKRASIVTPSKRSMPQKPTSRRSRRTTLNRTASQKSKSQSTASQKSTLQESSSSFVIPPGSQQVDLTLSSDVEVEGAPEKEDDGDKSYNDDFGLPKGPGWMQKSSRNTRRQSSAPSRTSSQMTGRARSSRRRTTTRF